MATRTDFHRICSPLFLDQHTAAPALLSSPNDTVISAQPGSGDQTDRLAPVHKALADEVASATRNGKKPWAVVGDCCQVIPVMAGLERANVRPTLVWLDSHGDFNTWETTPSGFLGGMPLAMLTGRGDQRMMKAVDLNPIADTRVVLSDGRDLDPGERVLVEQSGIRFLPNLHDVAPSALPEGPLYVHFDADILDARAAPAFLYPVAGGPDAKTMRTLIQALLNTGRVVAFSVCASWSTERDPDGKTLAAVKEALSPFLAE